ncbi:MAG: hypothetical protein ACRD2L_07585, partial [Terriglobia bacterium]
VMPESWPATPVMPESWSATPVMPVDAATQLRKLRGWLQTRAEYLVLERQSAARLRGSPEYPAMLQALNEQDLILQEVLRKMDTIESGSENPNKQTDFLGADQLPPAHLTDEALDL